MNEMISKTISILLLPGGRGIEIVRFIHNRYNNKPISTTHSYY